MSTCTDTFLCKETSFYILGSSVFYNQEGEGIPHPDLWGRIVSRYFIGLAFENRKELMEICYGAERGRIVQLADGTWILYGTPGAEQFKDQLVNGFRLDQVEFRCEFIEDEHYRVLENQRKVVLESVRYFSLKDQSMSLKFHSC